MAPERSVPRASDDPLWGRLQSFELDDPAASLTFSRRLARENAWSHEFALRVVEEYRRFVYLAVAAGHEVTPSDEVDQAWHLHLAYTRSYWDELCNGLLGRPLHHGPTKGGRAEGERFESQYERTLASYRNAFGCEPPADIWPEAAARFDEASDWVRVDRSRHWLLRKPWGVGSRRYATKLTLLAAVVPVGVALNPFDQFVWPPEPMMTFFVIAVLLSVVARLVRVGKADKNRRRNRSDSSSGCSTFFGGHGCSGSSGTSGDDGGSGCGASGCGGGGCGGGD